VRTIDDSPTGSGLHLVFERIQSCVACQEESYKRSRQSDEEDCCAKSKNSQKQRIRGKVCSILPH